VDRRTVYLKDNIVKRSERAGAAILHNRDQLIRVTKVEVAGPYRAFQ